MGDIANKQEYLDGLLREGRVLLDHRQSAMAVDKLLRLVRSLPPHGPFYEVACAQLSRAYQQQGKLKKAISMLRQAIKQSPKNPVYRLNLALMYKDDENDQRALIEARRALSLSPDLVEARELVAELMLEHGRVEATIDEANHILRRSPHNLRALDLLGTAFLYQGQLDRALTVVNQMIRLSPMDPIHHFKRAILLQQQGQVGVALGSFLRVVEMAAPESELAIQSREAVQTLDDYQIRQILLLASEDALFRYRLTFDIESAIRERGYSLSPTGIAMLTQVDFTGPDLLDGDRDYRFLS